MRSSPFASLALLLSAVAAAAAAAAGGADVDADVDGVFDTDAASTRTAAIYIQPVGPLSSSSSSEPVQPSLLAEILYDAADLSKAEVASYEAPDALPLEEGDGDENDESSTPLYRIGLYDPVSSRWLSATSVAAASNFAKGYRPHFVLTVAKSRSDGGGGSGLLPLPLAAAVRGLPIDAGATRDFGPQATVVEVGAGKTPSLNRPVVLSPEGKQVAPPEEKSFLQK